MASISIRLYRQEKPQDWLHEFKPHLLYRTLKVENATSKRLTVPRIQRLLRQAFPHIEKAPGELFLHKRPEGWVSKVKLLNGEQCLVLVVDNDPPESTSAMSMEQFSGPGIRGDLE